VPIKVVYTPLNGAGRKFAKLMFEKIGVHNVKIVKEQENPDGNFITCPYPNPEIPEALELAIKLGKKTKADLILATDPDSDRVGAAFFNAHGEFEILTGNEMGVLLLNYILSQKNEKKTLPTNPIVVKSIVSTKMAQKIAQNYNCEVKNVLTGFKYIGKEILELERLREEQRFVFGFEESLGFLTGSYVRDKDAILGSMLVCEMAAFYLKKGMNLGEVLQQTYLKYGFFSNKTLSFTLKKEKIDQVMQKLRFEKTLKIDGMDIVSKIDYLTQNLKPYLAKTDMLEFNFCGENQIIVRPSGTEPKIKFYLTVVGESQKDADCLMAKLTQGVNECLGLS
jgi:phosphoglucomutase